MSILHIEIPDWFLYLSSALIFFNTILGLMQLHLRRKIKKVTEEQTAVLKQLFTKEPPHAQ